MNTKTKTAAAVAATAKSTTDELLTLSIKDAEGKSVEREVAVAKAVLSLIKDGMAQATKLEEFWKRNADRIVEEFFGADPFPNMTAADMLAEFRADGRLDVMYAVFQTRHPEWSRAQAAKVRSANNPESDDAKNAADIYRSAILKIRRTANNQAIKVCRYYADSHGADKSSEEREQPGARQIIETAIADWSAKVASARGVFKLPAERVLLGMAVDALRASLVDYSKRKAGEQPTSLLSLDKPVGRAAQAAAQMAGEVATLTPEEYAEATAE